MRSCTTSPPARASTWRFYRGGPSQAQSNAQSSQSTGLGLTIFTTIMDLHGGSVQASSSPGGRTGFRLVFPA
ncbi:ATP-binding protein [Ralstonia pickettii]|uniref:ATP-binding protein n=1 Tax=Ralstonia pickettii TaxID=329 RepID=UPI00351041B4